MPWGQFDRQRQAITTETYRAILEGVPAMLWLGDAQGKCLYLNRAQREFWGISNEAIADFDWSHTLHPDDIPALQKAFAEAMARQQSFEVEARYKRADGNYRTLHTSANPRFSASGEFLGMSGVNVDVTERRASEQRVKMLTGELSHRIKNLFSVVGALISITRRENPLATEAFEDLHGRLLALSTAYQGTQDTAEHPSPKNLGDLVELTLAPFRKTGQITIRGLEIQLSRRATAAIALILNELATNSAKYGSLSGSGSLDITVDHVDQEWVLVTWTEHGVEYTDPSSCKSGFGSRLLDFTTQDIGAELTRHWEDQSFKIRIRIPRTAFEGAEQS